MRINIFNILVSFLALSLLVVCIIAFIGKVDNVIRFTTFEKAYAFTSRYQDIETVNVTIYVNQKDAYICDKDVFHSTYIADKDFSNQIKVDLNNIMYQNKSIKINNERYYIYNFEFILDFKTETNLSLEIEEAYLCLETKQGMFIKVLIGSFYLQKVPHFGSEELSISKLKGIVNEINGDKRLVGIVIGFRNHTNSNIRITNIEIFDVNIKISNNEYMEIFDDVSSNQPINLILGYSYEIDNIKDIDFSDLTLTKNQTYLFPLKYINNRYIENFGFKVEYVIDNKVKYLYFDNFTFFENNEYSLKKLNKLIFYTYENC